MLTAPPFVLRNKQRLCFKIDPKVGLGLENLFFYTKITHKRPRNRDVENKLKSASSNLKISNLIGSSVQH